MYRIIYGDILVSGFRVGSFSWDAGGIYGDYGGPCSGLRGFGFPEQSLIIGSESFLLG